MKIIVDEIPKEQKECLFSERTYSGNYVCKFQGRCIVCNPERCKFLKSIYDYVVDVYGSPVTGVLIDNYNWRKQQ